VAVVFVTERQAPFSTSGFAKLVERAGVAAKLPLKIHPHNAEAKHRLCARELALSCGAAVPEPDWPPPLSTVPDFLPAPGAGLLNAVSMRPAGIGGEASAFLASGRVSAPACQGLSLARRVPAREGVRISRVACSAAAQKMAL
jgi:hypothetical protein